MNEDDPAFWAVWEAIKRSNAAERADTLRGDPGDGYALSFCGTDVSSRYNVRREMENMLAALLAMCPRCAGKITSVWCDSKAGSVYTITLREGHESAAATVGSGFEAAIVERCGGHSGIFVVGSDVEFGGYWPDDGFGDEGA